MTEAKAKDGEGAGALLAHYDSCPGCGVEPLQAHLPGCAEWVRITCLHDAHAAKLRRVRIKPIFAWYDVWIGAFWDSAKRRLYVFPVPMLGVVIQFPARAA